MSWILLGVVLVVFAGVEMWLGCMSVRQAHRDLEDAVSERLAAERLMAGQQQGEELAKQDPLDAAIVEAAIHFYRHDDTSSVQEIHAAVRAKLDATKPKTAEAVLVQHWAIGRLTHDCMGCGEGTDGSDAGHVAHVVDQLREAGLLKEDTE